jgi:hypothetical protein
VRDIPFAPAVESMNPKIRTNTAHKNSFSQDIDLLRLDSCPICKESRLKIVGRTKTVFSGKDLEADLIECVSCLHWFISPMPSQEELLRLYGKASQYVVAAGGLPPKEEFSIPEKHIIRSESKRRGKRDRYLEIGVGNANLFNHFKTVGYDCFGVDPAPWAKAQPGIVKDIAQLETMNFDLIVMADVLEHLQDPLSYVKTIGEIMGKGTAYASFPNCQSLIARLSKEQWRMVAPFAHLHFFSRRSLLTVFESNGFHVERLSKIELLPFRLRGLVNPLNLFRYLTQSLWGEQWIVECSK